ncbi:MAG: nitrilase-related carbon-nitrogen hydrolase [Bacteroidia bacterium]
MMDHNSSRRRFLKKSALGVGLAASGYSLSAQSQQDNITPRLPREVWVGTVALENLRAANPEEMVRKVLSVMEKMAVMKPDIICLPESFATSNLESQVDWKAVAEEVPGPVVSAMAEFARKNNCYVICPTLIKEKGDMYIAAVLLDRKGKVAGRYLKMHPAQNEIESGVRPGPLVPPVFETDFGKIGIQICFDIKWEVGWKLMKDHGAEIVFWPSAYGGGREITSMAWRYQVPLVSATAKGASRICDITGEEITRTGRWQYDWICAPVNLEKAFLPAWPSFVHFPEIMKKYGQKIRLTTFDEEEWTIIESLDPEVKVADVLREFNLPTHHETITQVTKLQDANR